MLSPSQRETFHRMGLLKVEAAVPPADIATMRDRFWEYLSSKHGIDPDRVDTWTVQRPPASAGAEALRGLQPHGIPAGL